MKAEQQQKLAENNLELQHKLNKENAYQQKSIIYLLTQLTTSIFKILEKGTTKNGSATATSPDYATITLSEQDYDISMGNLQWIALNKLDMLRDTEGSVTARMIREAMDEIKRNNDILDIINK